MLRQLFISVIACIVVLTGTTVLASSVPEYNPQRGEQKITPNGVSSPPQQHAVTQTPQPAGTFRFGEEENRRLWNLQDVDIRTVIEQVARETGKSFIIDPAVNGKATIISNKELTPDELYQVFLSVLQVLGYAAIPNGDVIKIVPDANAKQLAIPFYNPQEPGDALVVSVIPVYHVGVAAMVPVLRNLVSQQGHLAAYAPSNVIIIADRADNVRSIQEIIERVDREEMDGAEVIPLENATASEVVASLEAIIGANRGANASVGQIAISADDRSNTIILNGEKTQRLKMRAIIAQLDTPNDTAGNTEVIYLRYQRAEDLVPVLGNVLTSYFGNTVGGSSNPVSTAAASRVNSGSANRASTTSGTSGTTESFSGFQTPERQATGTVIGAYGVQAEPNTNALIITAPPSLMRSLKAVIGRLDVRRAQVLVEAVIAEVSADRDNEFGIEWRGGGAVAGGVAWEQNGGAGLLDQYQNNINESGAGDAAIPGSGLNVGIIHNGSLRFLLHALSADTSSNILSTPSVIAMDNSEATISVGEAIPFEIGSYATTGNEATVTPFNTIEYREVGMQLVIKPQISQGDTIQLDIMQRVDSVGSQSNNQPTTNNRMVTTRVMVNDKDILVLGGLIQAQETEVVQKVPVLGDIPILGMAFRNTSKVTTRTNLMVFMRPTIIRDVEDGREVTNNKYNFIREQQILGNVEENSDVFESRFAPWQGKEPESLPIPTPFDE
jgi:general secretion pathway protein D